MNTRILLVATILLLPGLLARPGAGADREVKIFDVRQILRRIEDRPGPDLSLFGDFDPITHVTVDANLFKANNSSISYCAYGGYSPSKPYPVAEYIVFTNNVFERGPNRRCGVFGAITSFDPGATGNRWSGNMWDDRTVLNP